MDLDPLSIVQTPPSKRRKMMAVMIPPPPPPTLSDLLSAFGARRVQSSVSKLSKLSDDMDLRPQRPGFSYAESNSTNSPTQVSEGSTFGDTPESSKTSAKLTDDTDDTDSEDELSSGDVIRVAPRQSGTRELPNRSTRSRVSNASPKKKKSNKAAKARKAKQSSKFTSDLNGTSKAGKRVVRTERDQVRHDIAAHTKPKRDAFFLANKDYFLPLLPQTSYIDKLQRLHDMGDNDEIEIAPHNMLDEQPEGVTATMKPYQLEGLSFLVHMHQNGMPSILGDEMGLGKTLQTLSLFQWLKENEPTKGEHRPYLIVCPLSVLSSWMNEAKKWVPELNVVRFHGPVKEREKLKEECRMAGKAAQIDIIVTTYETFVSEQGWFKRAFVWRYCVLDEGHKIKNDKSDIAHSLQSLSAEYRLLLTGTPLQNNLQELWALLHWLYPEVFTSDTADGFKRAFDLTKGKVSRDFISDARRLLELIMLRRMKSTPGVNLGLPPKEEILLYVPLTPMQRFWYTRFLTKVPNGMLEQVFKGAKAKELESLQQEAEEKTEHLNPSEATNNELFGINGVSEDVWAESKQIMEKAVQNEDIDTKSTDWRKLMNLILQLRKICSHPYLLPHAEPEPYYLGEHVTTASGKFIVLEKIIDELVVKQKKKILVFAGFTGTLNLIEDLLAMKGANSLNDAGFRYLRLDGGTSRARRNLGIRMFNDLKSDFRVMLISTRAGGLGVNLATASDVVFMDEDWNPQVTVQAEARAHRIGQVNKVTVYKLCSSGTVEEQMLGRIRKKLYLSSKVDTESMLSTNASGKDDKKRKRGSNNENFEEDGPHLDASSLKSLIRRGAQTLSRPEVDATEMLKWDWDTTLEQCKDRPMDVYIDDEKVDDATEEKWLNTMERVETAVFEGKKYQKEIEQKAKGTTELDRADRRVGKNTTVMIDGFAINKESLDCGDWEAVPTLAGKDPRLAEPPKQKKAAIQHQDFCQTCWDGGEVVCCAGCPRSYHIKCLEKSFRAKAKGSHFYCPQHECLDCQAKTVDAGGLIYRCRWCENGFCEDCVDWDVAKLIGETLPEYEMLGLPAKDNAWYIECPACIKRWETDEEDHARVIGERERIEDEYSEFLATVPAKQPAATVANTPATMSEVGTPAAPDFAAMGPPAKKTKLF